MKKIIALLISILIIGLTIFYKDEITTILSRYIYSTPKVVVPEKNKYAKNQSFDFVKITDDFIPYSYQDLLNIVYTVLDSGFDTFTFYCPPEYLSCIDDIERISDENNIDVLTTLGNFVHPYNNFTNIKVQYDQAGEITLNVNHLYSKEEIREIDNELDTIWKTIVNEDMSNLDIIYNFHDYIINNTKYDRNYETELKNNRLTTYKSNKASGPLFDGYAICSGYTDLMALILDRIGITNFKVASDNHVWNALLIDGKWLNLDLTWDDPVSKDENIDTLLHKFYLIDSTTLQAFDLTDHNFDKSIYREIL